MTKGRIAKYADQDTPENVRVNSDTLNLLIWAIGRFGIGIVFAFMTWKLYQDQRSDTQILREVIQENNKALFELKQAINQKN